MDEPEKRDAPPGPEEFVERLLPALHQAGSVARALEGRVGNQPKEREGSAVKAAMTVADAACQEALLAPLFLTFPQVCLAAEEDTPSVARFAREGPARVVVDPIDGTLRSYLEGRGPYSVLMGLEVEGRYRAALVGLPREGLYFDAVRGGGACLARGCGARQPARLHPEGERVLVSHDLPRAAWQVLEGAGLDVVPASGGAIAVAPLVPGVRAGLRLVQREPRVVSIRGRIGVLVAEEAGAQTRCESGAPFPRDLTTPVRALLVGATAAELDLLQEALAAAGVGPGAAPADRGPAYMRS